VYTATPTQVLAYTLPQFIVSMLIMDYMYGKVRTPFVSEIYEILQSMYAFIAVCKVIANPKAPTFRVTPKGEDMSQTYISSLAGPFYLVYILSIVSLLFGIWRFFAFQDADERSVTIMTMCWELFNLIILNTALGVLHEKKKTRGQIRIRSNIAAILHLPDGTDIAGKAVDITMGGAMIELEQLIPQLYSGMHCTVTLHNHASNKESKFPAELRYILGADQRTKIGMAINILFEPENLQTYKELVMLNYGDSDRWNDFMRLRQQKRPGIWRGFFLILRLGFMNMKMDYPHFVSDCWFLLREVSKDLWLTFLADHYQAVKRVMRRWALGK
jgi:cellulose synthase (UDP-forming)